MINKTITAKTLVLASNNNGKLVEFQQLFDTAHLDIKMVKQAEFAIDDADETGLSFVENAIIKARHAANLSGKAALADDSGLCVPILGGAPGIYSARFAGQHGNDALNNQKLLTDLLPFRGEKPIVGLFVCVLALVRHATDPLPIICHGIWHGEVLENLRGENGFGYDPLFWLPQLGKSSAELDKTEKNEISHRAQAMQHMIQLLSENPQILGL